MPEWVLWCGCPLPSTGIVALPDASRMREETCAVCGRVVPPHARAHRIRREAARWPIKAA